MGLRNSRKAKTPLEKEQKFIKYGTNILVVVVIIFAVVVSGFQIYKQFNESPNTQTSLNALSKLSDTVDVSSLYDTPLSDEDKPALIEKLKTSGLDILENDEISYTKFSKESITILENLSLTANDVGLLYSYLFVENPANYDVFLYHISLVEEENTLTLKTVSTIDLYSLFTSKLNDNVSYKSKLPKRVYITNTVTISENKTYSTALLNNLTEEESKEILETIKSVNNINLNSYIPNLILTMLDNLSSKTSTTLNYANDSVSFTIAN